MDAYEFHNLNPEKSNAILLYNNLKCVTKLLRIVEICLGLVLLSWTSTRLPFAVKISVDYFRQLIAIMISPLFTFLLCNVIVVTLLIKGGRRFVGQSSAVVEIDADFYEGFIETGDDVTASTNADISPVNSDEIVYQDKETIFEEISNTAVQIGDFETPEDLKAAFEVGKADAVSEVPEMKDLRRSKSEKLKMENIEVEVEEEESDGKLRRSETEKWRKVANPGEIPEETLYIFDELSNEEFQKTIEEFIAKQIKFHQEEKLAIVLSSHV